MYAMEIDVIPRAKTKMPMANLMVISSALVGLPFHSQKSIETVNSRSTVLLFPHCIQPPTINYLSPTTTAQRQETCWKGR